METHHCQCNQACHLRDYSRPAAQRDGVWNKHVSGTSQEHRVSGKGTVVTPVSRFKLKNGLLSVENGRSLLERSKSRSLDWVHWVRINLGFIVVVVMLSVTIVMPLYWHVTIATHKPEAGPRSSAAHPSDVKLGRIMRSLRSAQTEADRQELQHQQATNNTLAKFPWIEQKNTLMNYFIGGMSRAGSSSYTHSNIVFLHHHRSAGSAMEQCLKEIANHSNLDNVKTWDSSSKTLWDRKTLFTAKLTKELTSTKSESTELHTGQYSFGICDVYSKRQCSYFLLLRDPMERALSSYRYCQKVGLRGDQEWCRVVDANEVTLRDWILLHGSLTFQQFLYNATWCDSKVPHSGRYLLDGTSVEIAPSEQWPCWLTQRHRIEQLSKEDQGSLLQYIVDNLETWFGVVGLVDQLDKSLVMFEKVYGLPFTRCQSLRSYDINGTVEKNHSNRDQNKRGYYDDNDPGYLQYDYFVRKALEPDYAIYKRAKKIYNIQKQMLFNSL